MMYGGIPQSGHLRLHLLKGDFSHHTGGMFHSMNPVVHIHVGQMQNWRSQCAVDGGQHPRFHMQFMDIEVRYCQQMVRIDVHDLNGNGAPIIGTCELPLERFARNGGCEEWVEIFNFGMPAGRLHFRSEFVNGGMMVNQDTGYGQQNMMMNQGYNQNMGMGNQGMMMNQGYNDGYNQNMGMGMGMN